MKKILYLLSFSSFIFLSSCGNQESGETQNQEVSDSLKFQNGSRAHSSETKSNLEIEFLALDELPQTIEDKIEKDKLLSTFTLKKVAKVNNGEEFYYDLTFEDPDKQKVMASFDINGNIIKL